MTAAANGSHPTTTWPLVSAALEIFFFILFGFFSLFLFLLLAAHFPFINEASGSVAHFRCALC